MQRYMMMCTCGERPFDGSFDTVYKKESEEGEYVLYTDALAEIEKAKREGYQKGLEDASRAIEARWRPVSQRPKQDGWYFVRNIRKSEQVSTCFFELNIWGKPITHWMPIPEVPQCKQKPE